MIIQRRKEYHTHTFRCNHAEGDAPDYALAAIKNKISVLGFSDHTALPDNKWIKMRMGIDDLDGYVASVRECRSRFAGKIKILLGMECDYAKEYRNFYNDELKERYKFDYLIGGAHLYPMNGEWKFCYGGIKTREELDAYAEYLIELMQSGLFDFIAHPDLFGNSYLDWDKNTIEISRLILKTAEETKTALEINGYGFRKPAIRTTDGRRAMYPLFPFWELAAEYDISVVINSDAHRPKDLSDKLKKPHLIVRKNGLKPADFSYLEKE